MAKDKLLLKTRKNQFTKREVVSNKQLRKKAHLPSVEEALTELEEEELAEAKELDDLLDDLQRGEDG